MEKNKVGLRFVMDVVAMALLVIPFIIINGLSLALTGIHSLWVYSFGSEKLKERRRAEMAEYRKNMFNFD